MNVKEYANNDAKLYDNRVVTIEELTVVGRDGHLIEETKRGSTSPTVSSKYILSQYRDFVNRKYSISENHLATAGDHIGSPLRDEGKDGVGTGVLDRPKKGKGPQKSNAPRSGRYLVYSYRFI